MIRLDIFLGRSVSTGYTLIRRRMGPYITTIVAGIRWKCARKLGKGEVKVIAAVHIIREGTCSRLWSTVQQFRHACKSDLVTAVSEVVGCSSPS